MASSATDSANKDKLIREKLVKTGHVDVMMSVGNNFFYTLSLPCSLWFFDKGKKKEIRDKVLFIDARNYYTVVDRTLNEWTEWQLKNLQAIVHLYRGEQEKYKKVLAEYRKAIASEAGKLYAIGCEEGCIPEMSMRNPAVGMSHADIEFANEAIPSLMIQAKEWIKVKEAEAPKREQKAIRQKGESFCNDLSALHVLIKEYFWLVDKFGTEGEYQDVLGLCKIATISEIEEKNWSLTPGAYVGVAEVEDDGIDFRERMNEIHAELSQLNAEANVLMNEIMKEWGDLNTK